MSVSSGTKIVITEEISGWAKPGDKGKVADFDGGCGYYIKLSDSIFYVRRDQFRVVGEHSCIDELKQQLETKIREADEWRTACQVLEHERDELRVDATAYRREHDPTPVTREWFQEEIQRVELRNDLELLWNFCSLQIDLVIPPQYQLDENVITSFTTRDEVRQIIALLGMVVKP